jgi:hypothetical protein
LAVLSSVVPLHQWMNWAGRRWPLNRQVMLSGPPSRIKISRGPSSRAVASSSSKARYHYWAILYCILLIERQSIKGHCHKTPQYIENKIKIIHPGCSVLNKATGFVRLAKNLQNLFKRDSVTRFSTFSTPWAPDSRTKAFLNSASNSWR